MPVKRRKVKARNFPLQEWKANFLLTGELPPNGTGGFNKYEGGEWVYHSIRSDDPVFRAWKEYRNKLLPEWIEKAPGTRPYAWWEFDAPRQEVESNHNRSLPITRKRIGGVGTPTSEASRFCGRHMAFGIPQDWVTKETERFYKNAEAYSETDPPTFEPEVDYLRRFNLLTDDEKVILENTQPGTLD